MTFIIIDQDGDLHRRDGDPTYDALVDAVGPEGYNQVRLNPGYRLAGWANDCGLVMPDRYARNPVGSCLLGALGAAQQPYAGPLAVTGWDPHNDGWEPVPVPDTILAMVESLHTDVRTALAGGDVPHQSCRCGCGADWAAEVRRYAETVRTGPTPGITILSGGDASRWLSGGGDLP